MNQSTTTSSSREREPSLFTSGTEDEITVSHILLDLKNLMSLTESLTKFNWKCKRRRSCLDDGPPLPSAPSRPSTSVKRTEDDIQQRRTEAEEAVVVVKKHDGAAHTTASPDTPFFFSPSDESDEKFKHSSKKTSKKMSREEYLDMIEELTQTKDLLRGEMENVKKYYNKLNSYNSLLKEVLNSSLKKEEEKPRMEIQNDQVNTALHPQTFTANLTARDFKYSISPITSHSQPSTNGLGSVGLDLNIPAHSNGVDLSQPLDVSCAIADKRARFAEARKKRIGIIKVKNRPISYGV